MDDYYLGSGNEQPKILPWFWSFYELDSNIIKMMVLKRKKAETKVNEASRVNKSTPTLQQIITELPLRRLGKLKEIKIKKN